MESDELINLTPSLQAVELIGITLYHFINHLT